jgi:hypothetical protein
MKRITAPLAVGLLIGSFVTQATLGALQSEPAAKGPKLTLNAVEAQVTALQTQVNSLESELHSLETKVTSQPMFAVVNQDGTLSRGSGNVAKTERLNTGSYVVTFSKDISGCEYNATIGLAFTGEEIAAGLIFVDSQPMNHDAVVISVLNLARAGMDVPFHLSVICE